MNHGIHRPQRSAHAIPGHALRDRSRHDFVDRLRTYAQHSDGAAVLRPAGDVVANRDRTLLAVRDRPHALSLDAARDQIVTHRLRAACTQRDVVLARAALVGMALDGELAVLDYSSSAIALACRASRATAS